jgi:integrase
MTVRKRGGHWHYDFTIRGKRYREAIPEARNKAQAERAETQARQAVYDRRYALAGDSITFGEYVTKTYRPWAKLHKKSFQSDDHRLKAILPIFEKQFLSAITTAQIERYKQARFDQPAKLGGSDQTKPRAAQSVNHDLALLSRIFTLAQEQGIVAANPVKQVRRLPVNNRRTRVCSVEEERQLLAELPPTVRAMFRVAIQTGMRRGEIVNLDWTDVDFLRGQVHIRESKTGKPRVIPMSVSVRTVFAEQFQRKGIEPAIFLSRKGPTRGTRLINPDAVLKKTCARLGIEGLHWHDLRHTAATRMADAGIDPFVMAELLGHADLNMTQRYTHATDQRRQEAVNALANYDGHKSVTRTENRMAG